MADARPQTDGADNSDARKQKRDDWKQLVLFAAFLCLDVWVLSFSELKFDNWRGWMVPIGAVIFGLATAFYFLKAVCGWSEEKASRVIGKVLLWVVGLPVAIGLCILAFVSVSGWLGSIPSWAAVIIILLVMILLKLKG